MFARLWVYLKEMYPLPSRLFVGFVMYFEIFFLVILTNGRSLLKIGAAEIIGAFTIFAFLLFLRVADDFKDLETDKLLFPERPLPSGRFTKRDLIISVGSLLLVMAILNLAIIRNYIFFGILIGYAALMSVWFFCRYQIQNNLMLAVITHNPVQVVLTCYVISSVCLAYQIPLLTMNNLLIAFTFYFPGLIWEISRKVKAPEQETDYVTYSILAFQLVPWGVIPTVACYIWLVYTGISFIHDPTRFQLVKRVDL